ncbi:MAG: SHOCT domain-containing protein [Syntrophobacterales bacterium]|nr:MAG: SHOCT domain-containing protein [Syntrophobacterales bacterium]
MGFMWIILIIIIIAVILLAKGYYSPFKKESGSTGESALDVLKKRYARGEISKEEFEEKKRDLI